jgi:uncharacterized membrane protein
MDNPSLGKRFRTRFFTGLFITFPVALTLISVIWLFDLLDGLLGHQIDRVLGMHVPGLGIILSVIIVFCVGVLATTVFGQRFIGWIEKLIMKTPVLKSFYNTFKQLGDAFSPHNRAAFKQFVLVEYPRQGARSFGFLTKECMIKNSSGTDVCYVSVYIPTNHLYLGDIALFRKEEVIVTDLTIEEGIRVILSAGIAAPNVIVKSKDYSLMSDTSAQPAAEHPSSGAVEPSL